MPYPKTSNDLNKAVEEIQKLLKSNDESVTEQLKRLATLSAGSPESHSRQDEIVNELKRKAASSAALGNISNEMIQLAAVAAAKSRGSLANQTTVATVMEEQLSQARQGLDKVAGSQENKMRMVEINTYYSDKYRAQSSLVKLIIVVVVAFLLVVILMKRELIPQEVAVVLIVGILLIGGLLVGLRYWNISSRDNMVFDEFDFRYANPPPYEPGEGRQDSIDMGVPCYDQLCCAEGTRFVPGSIADGIPNQCLPAT